MPHRRPRSGSAARFSRGWDIGSLGNDAVDIEETDYDYYRRRASEELAKSRQAADPGLAAKHRQLSAIYTSRALQAERKQETEGPDESVEAPHVEDGQRGMPA